MSSLVSWCSKLRTSSSERIVKGMLECGSEPLEVGSTWLISKGNGKVVMQARVDKDVRASQSGGGAPAEDVRGIYVNEFNASVIMGSLTQTLGQLRKPEHNIERAGLWRIHPLRRGQVIGWQALTYSALLYRLTLKRSCIQAGGCYHFR
jgi:hypothetical protein